MPSGLTTPLSLLNTIALSSKHRCCGWLLKHLLARMEEITNKTPTKKVKKNKQTKTQKQRKTCVFAFTLKHEINDERYCHQILCLKNKPNIVVTCYSFCPSHSTMTTCSPKKQDHNCFETMTMTMILTSFSIQSMMILLK